MPDFSYSYVGNNPIGFVDPLGLYKYAIEFFVEYARHDRSIVNDGISATGHTAYRLVSDDPGVASTPTTGLRPESGWSPERSGWSWDVATGFNLTKRQYEDSLKSSPSDVFNVTTGQQCTTGAMSKAASAGLNILVPPDTPSVVGLSTPPQVTPHSLGNFLESLNHARTLQWNAIQNKGLQVPANLRIPGYTIAPGRVP